ncbi:DNA starvation/stationary phase protection protein Dps [Rhodopirellula sp. MGV]|uniref:DNA starvation/stationary phase protection protein Dps n=1 Tax=Rhodopirellula sp. MGV TaxID=2023130 RepID=UPI000B978221|nr:DNA starvation/stationary phase protection protein Dps [Rhodopirellula sp. MGV]OYP28891.1 DNA starvation/stationary phase protection protein Dps [Rhodopirellula sp. MGV]PNY36992.1 DNA starvation/stationary phase protection protein Dps [Rhodopirellula baltica]
MSTTTTPFKRTILEGERLEATTNLLQQNLVDLVDLALLLKQAHWNVIGKNFRSVHLQLDEIIVTVRAASDEVAERIAALGVTADGRASTVAKNTDLKEYPSGFQNVDATLAHVGDALKTTIDGLRKAIDQVGDLDPISEDMLIAISGPLEKHLWMVQAQEA